MFLSGWLPANASKFAAIFSAIGSFVSLRVVATLVVLYLSGEEAKIIHNVNEPLDEISQTILARKCKCAFVVAARR